MDIQILDTPLYLNVYGFSGVVLNGDNTGTALKLMDKMWQVVKSNGLGHKGKNIWIYEKDNRLFAGVELDEIPKQEINIEHKSISLPMYAYYKHVGSYNLIKQIGQTMNSEISKRGFEAILPYVEIYGHWTNDESKLETELLKSIQ